MPDRTEGDFYEIRVKGHLDNHWATWFECMTLTAEDCGETLLSGAILDQSALQGIILRILDLGLPLLSVSRVEPSCGCT